MTWQLHLRLDPLLADAVDELIRARTGCEVAHTDGLKCTFESRPDAAFIDALGTWLFNLGAHNVAVRSRRGDTDWVDGFRALVTAAPITSDIWVRPPWEADPPGVPHCLVLEPGLSFGTGTHATTRLSMTLLETALHPGDRVLDLGCGSGILGIAAAQLGAEVLGIEIDPAAVAQARANAALNGVADRTRWTSEPLTADQGRFEIVVANMFLGVLTQLAPDIRHACSGTLIVSGLLVSEEAAFGVAYPDFTVEQRLERDGWLGLRLTPA